MRRVLTEVGNVSRGPDSQHRSPRLNRPPRYGNNRSGRYPGLRVVSHQLSPPSHALLRAKWLERAQLTRLPLRGQRRNRRGSHLTHRLPVYPIGRMASGHRNEIVEETNVRRILRQPTGTSAKRIIAGRSEAFRPAMNEFVLGHDVLDRLHCRRAHGKTRWFGINVHHFTGERVACHTCFTCRLFHAAKFHSNLWNG